MPADLDNKRIIFIHGLASKPPAAVTHDLWQRTLTENIRVYDKRLAARLDRRGDVIESAYWADAVPHHIPDDRAYCKKLRAQVDKVIAERRAIRDRFHVGLGEKAAGFFKDRGLDLAKLLTSALTIKDDVMTRFLRETELYEQDQYIADQIRAPLETALRRAWDDGIQPVVIAHSMGSFIAYDVLWRFSHRRVDGFRQYRRKRVKLLATMGSPLGDPTVRALLFSAQHREHGRRRFPTNIDYWHNYACLGDIVAHQKDFEAVFFEPMRELGLWPDGKPYRAIDYVRLHNPFEVVTHAGNRKREKRNPHKSYGYLAQPRLGSWVADYLLDRLA